MNEKQIIVPENMLKASLEALRIRWQYRLGWEPDMNTVEANRLSIATALLWLDKQLYALQKPNDTHWEAGYNSALRDIREKFLVAEADPLVMYIMRHFDDVDEDARTRRNRAEAAVADYKEHLRRNALSENSK